jgi:hypothetical protein
LWRYGECFVALRRVLCGVTASALWRYGECFVALRRVLCGVTASALWRYGAGTEVGRVGL